MKTIISTILALLLFPLAGMAQNITGRVIDAQTGGALPGASISWEGTTSGTTSLADGSFTLARNSASSTLTIKFLGYTTQQIDVAADTGGLTVEMQPDDEVAIDAVMIETRQRGNYAKQSGITRNEQISFAGLCKMACCNLAESFENSASVTVGYSDAISGARQIKMLGLAGTYTQILDENRPIMQGAGASYGLSYTPGMWLNSIQVSKGVASVTAGHEAITGQINLEHRKPTDDERLFLNLYFDSELRPEINLSTALPVTRDKRLSTVILAHGSMDTRRYDHNDDGFVDMPKANQINVANKWLYQTQGGTQIRWGWKVVDEQRLGGQMNYRDSMRDQMLPSATTDTPIYGSKIHNRDINAYMKVGIPIGAEQAFGGDEADAVQNNLAMILDYDNYSTDSYFGLNTADVVENAVSFNLMYAHYFSLRSSLNVGASAHVRMLDNDYRTFRVADKTVMPAWSLTGEGTISEPGVYAEYTYSIKDKFSLVVGMRADYSAVGGDYYIHNAKDRMLLTPRSHLRWSITPRTTLRASAGMGYRRVNLITDNIWVMTTSRTIRLADNLLNGGVGRDIRRQPVADVPSGRGRSGHDQLRLLPFALLQHDDLRSGECVERDTRLQLQRQVVHGQLSGRLQLDARARTRPVRHVPLHQLAHHARPRRREDRRRASAHIALQGSAERAVCHRTLDLRCHGAVQRPDASALARRRPLAGASLAVISDVLCAGKLPRQQPHALRRLREHRQLHAARRHTRCVGTLLSRLQLVGGMGSPHGA